MTREEFEAVGIEHNCKLSEKADRIMEIVNKRGGKCPCRIDGTLCPCPMLDDDLEKTGKCYCGLYER